MKRFIATFIALLLLSTSLAWSQTFTLSGIITDRENGKPVDYATVVLESSEQWAMHKVSSP